MLLRGCNWKGLQQQQQQQQQCIFFHPSLFSLESKTKEKDTIIGDEPS